LKSFKILKTQSSTKIY